MSETGTTNQLSPRATANNRWPRKWSTLGGRATSSSTTRIPTNDAFINENSSKTNGHRCQSTSLFRKASTISRSNGAPIVSDENTNQTLKKSRSLMNVLRSKLNSPAVLRRFRSKSRESSKHTVTEINGHIATEHHEVEQPTPPPPPTTMTRKSRKRDPSPMRRFANRISQFTRHQRMPSNERQKKSPSKSITNDSQDGTRKSPSPPIPNKNEVEHINACYDEIRAKYFNNDTINKRNISNDDTTQNPDILNTSPRIISPILSDDPLLQARKQANIKLNCLLSGYNLTTSFANYEKSYGRNDIFKFHHYYDVGKTKYDWNFTNPNNRVFPSMRTRPMSRSIDNFRPINIYENQTPIPMQNVNIVHNDLLDQAENHQDVPRISSDDNELVIREDSDLIQTTSPYSTNLHITPSPRSAEINRHTSIHTDENKPVAYAQLAEEHDEEFERNFLRAVDRALGVVNKDEEHSKPPIYDVPKEPNESTMNLIEMTERALSSFNNISIFTDDDESTEPVTQVDMPSPIVTNGSYDVESVDNSLDQFEHIDESLPIITNGSNGFELVEHNLEKLDPSNEPSSSIVTDHNHESVENGIELVEQTSPIVTNGNNVDHIDKSSSIVINGHHEERNNTEDISSVINDLIQQIEEFKNGQTFLAKLDEEEKTLKSRSDGYYSVLHSNDPRLTEDVSTDISAVIGEVNLLLRGKLKQFRGLCEANVTKSSSGAPIPLDSDLEGFWDITYPLIDKVKEKFAKLDARKAKQWAPIEEYDPDDINNRSRVINDRLKQLQPQQNKSSKIPTAKSANGDLKKLIQERRKAAANTTNQILDIEIFVAPK